MSESVLVRPDATFDRVGILIAVESYAWHYCKAYEKTRTYHCRTKTEPYLTVHVKGCHKGHDFAFEKSVRVYPTNHEPEEGFVLY